MLVGVDIGGTFTDLILSDAGQLRIHKLLSTPHNPAQAMLDGLTTITPTGLDALTQVAHGSTVATNAILERKGARIALLTTAGFRDVLLIGRQNRPDLYSLHPTLPAPLIPRERCYDIPERLDHHGNILTDLDMDALERVLDALAKQAIDAIAVCLLYSFINPRHEQAIRDRIVAHGLLESWQVILSSDVLPEFREYERASTTALEAYVRPKMARYISHLADELPADSSLRIMKSDGGVMSAGRIHRQAINTALSGPAAGVIGAFHLAQLAGYEQIITLDMGGTSTDVALCPGAPRMASTSTIDGLPLRSRFLDIETIGAGGGSIARVDAGGALRVGPESAGAEPGPIIYGQGGTAITVSDANALLGRLDAEHFLGGEMRLHLDPARAAFDDLAQQTRMSAIDTAKGVIDVANVNIDRALRRVSVARGYDPRTFTLMAFGGAGALHACDLADRLDMERVLVPRYPGVLCALGLLVADVKIDHSLPILQEVDETSLADIQAHKNDLLARGRADLQREGIADDAMQFDVLLDMRYQGQAHELTLPLGDDPRADFHAAHRNAYGHALDQRPVEIVNLRLQAIGHIDKPTLEAVPVDETATAEDAYLGTQESPLGGTIDHYDREKLPAGARFNGEALVFQLDSTVYVAAGWSARVDGYYNLILERDA